ncbi:MAG: NAD(P)/FAD-dependent oxidoreductase [Actinobacteria bacterium]|nr:NAD(P)/FAD-dependent oxidoreductase [Actinomycetota bacterium]
MKTYDAVVVGARCGGSVVAGKLAREGWNVLLVDKARFPSDTVSTHAMFANTLARFDALGILERLYDRHQIPRLFPRWRILEHELSGSYTAVGGYTYGISVRRIALDSVLVDWAIDGGVKTSFGERVQGLIGSGADGDPLRGVILEGGEEIHAPWVIGADGRASTVASLLNLEKTKPMTGEMAYLFAYWRGLPQEEVSSIDVNYSQQALMHNPGEDGIDLLSVGGPPEITRGSTADREKAYAARLHAFPESFDAGHLDKAERISDLIVVPETMMRGFFRRATGPGWVLVGDAGHFKHPGTAQGISDAVEQAIYVADAMAGDDPELEGFHEWRQERSSGHYEWSFIYGSWPVLGMAEPFLSGLAADSEARQDWLDTFTRIKGPSDVTTPERLGKWLSG